MSVKPGAYDGIYKTYEEAAEALKKFAGENAAVDGKGKRKEVKLAIYKRRTDGTMFIGSRRKAGCDNSGRIQDFIRSICI